MSCTICKGERPEHFDSEGQPITKHKYTEKEGDLAPHEVKPAQPQIIRLPGAQTNEAGAIGRLCEVLIENGTISRNQALYVAGMGPKPRGFGFMELRDHSSGSVPSTQEGSN